MRLAEAYQAEGHHARAADFADAALELTEAVPSGGARLRALARRIDVHLAQQHSVEAGELMLQMLPLAEHTADLRLRALALNTKGNVLRFVDDYTGALPAYREAADVARKARDTLLQIQALGNAADTAVLQEQPERAREFLQAAWRQARTLAPGHLRLRESLALARTALAVEAAPLAAALLEHAREDVKHSADTRLQAYYYGYLGQLYESAGRYPEALRLTERARFLVQDDDALAYLWQWQRGRIVQAQGEIDAAAEAYLEPDAQQPVLEETRAVLEALKTAVLEDYFQDECVAALRRRSGASTVPPRTAVLYPVVLPERTELLLHLPDGLRRAAMTVPATRVEALAAELQRQLQTRVQWKFIGPAKALYEILVQPVRAVLARYKVETLVFVPDGALRLIPPAALAAEDRYLVEDFAVVTVPGMDLTDTGGGTPQSVSSLLGGLS